MAIGVHHETATIYTFPGKRFTAADRHQTVDLEKDIEPSVYESCWYHNEAIKEAETPSPPRFKPRIVD